MLIWTLFLYKKRRLGQSTHVRTDYCIDSSLLKKVLAGFGLKMLKCIKFIMIEITAADLGTGIIVHHFS